MRGPTDLPNDVKQCKINYPFLFTSIVYEFDGTSDHAKFVAQSKLTGLTQLLGSKIVKVNGSVVPSSICFNSKVALLQ